MTCRQDNDTPALNALKALRGAPISMGRGETPEELCQQPSVFASFYFSIFKLLKGVTMQENELPKGKENKASENPLEETTTYRIEGRSFVVKPVFKEGNANTFGAILLRLMQADCERKL
jgi:hypothetical protein